MGLDRNRRSVGYSEMHYNMYKETSHSVGPPQCPSVHTTATKTSFTVSLMKSQMKFLPEGYHVMITSYSRLMTEVNSTLTSGASFDVTSLEPDTVYNISVTPCNMAGCNESCDVQSVQTMESGEIRVNALCN